jgi:molybdenum cofactor biosynthesis enzyme MoaA
MDGAMLREESATRQMPEPAAVASPGGFTTIRMAFTAACNMNCFYCHNEGQAADVTSRPRPIDLGQFDVACQLLRANGLSVANVTGGEFAMNQQWRDLLWIARERFADLVITTNGSLLSEVDIDFIAQLGPSRFNVSLDTADPAAFAVVTRSPHHATVVWTMARLFAVTGAEIVTNTVLLRNVNDTVEALRGIARLIHPYSRQVNIIKPHLNAHRPGFHPAGIEYYDAFVAEAKAASDSFAEKSYPDGSTNVKVMLDGVQFNFKNIYPRHDAAFCQGCQHVSRCTEWIIPPRFFVETGELAACLLNRSKRLRLYGAEKDLEANTAAARLLLASAWSAIRENVLG